MKIALVHDYIKEYGGAERVLESLHQTYPDAPIFTSVYLPRFLGPHRDRFKNWDIRTSFLQYFPFKAKLISIFRLFSPLAFKSFDFSEFDVIIVSATGAYFPNALKKQKAIQICYCHTPPRYLYGYMTARDWKKNPVIAFLGEIANHFLRLVDFRAAQNVNYFIANSKETASRIQKFYRRRATVIYPPVDINPKLEIRNPKNTKYKIHNTGYYLTGGRLARAKGTDIVIEAFKKLGKPLKIFGRGFAGHDKNSEFIIHNSEFRNIEYLGEVTDREKLELMRNAKAFIFAAFEEDFGLTPVEAMSVGAPVIAYKSGGVKETVVDGLTGVFYESNTPEELIKAVQRFEKLAVLPTDCIKQAQKFSKERFKKEIVSFVDTSVVK